MVLSAALTAPALAQHNDLWPHLSGTALRIGIFDFTNQQAEDPDRRVFGYEFDNPNDPFFLGDPGIAAGSGAGATGLTAGSAVRFNLLADLKYWDGTGDVSIGAVPNSETLRLRKGFSNVTTGTGTGFVTGLNWDVVAADGSVHSHLSAFLQGSDGNAVPAGPGIWGTGDGVEATAGLYVVTMELTTDQAGIADSPPIRVVFDSAAPAGALDTLVAYLLADFDVSDVVNATDIDLLTAGFDALATDSPYDLDGDGDADDADVTVLVEDGQVNALDLSVMASNWLGSGIGWAGGDFNGDTQVNALDLSAMASNWLFAATEQGVAFDQALATVGLGGIPEPGSAVLLLVAGGTLMMRRRR